MQPVIGRLLCYGSIMAMLLLAACGELPPGPTARATPTPNNQATQAALALQTELARPSRTPTLPPTLPPTQTLTPTTQPTALTPTPSPTRVSALPGMLIYTHPDLPDYVFQIDPAAWEKGPSGDSEVLAHKSISGCQIQAAAGHGIETPESLYWLDLGRFRWEVLDYSSWAYAYPILRAGGSAYQGSFLLLEGYNRKSCRAAQEEILTNLMSAREANGEENLPPFQSPTPRPALEGFSCPDTPPARLRVGDQVAVITNGLWLRSEPRVDNSTRVRQFLRYPPYRITVTGGPVCEQYVFWQVQINAFGEGSEQGWLAEGDLEAYYLLPVK